MLLMVVGVVPSALQLPQRNAVWGIAVNLIRGHVDKDNIRLMTAAGLQEIERPNRIGVKIIEGNRCRAVVGRLGGGVDQKVRRNRLYEILDTLSVADVQFVVGEAPDGILEAVWVPAG